MYVLTLSAISLRSSLILSTVSDALLIIFEISKQNRLYKILAKPKTSRELLGQVV